MQRKRAEHLCFLVSSRVHLMIIWTLLGSERVEPLQQFHIAFPTRWFAWPHRRIYFFESLAFGFHIGSSVNVCRVQAFMSKPAADDCDVDAGGYQRSRGRVAKSVGRDSFAG